MVAIKHALDDRYDEDKIVSHDGTEVPCLVCRHVDEYEPEPEDVLFVDEFQFFDKTNVRAIDEWSREGHRVVVAGLDMDYRGDPFETVALAMAVARRVDKLTAICVVCGQPAEYSHRRTSAKGQIQVGGHDAYEARCHRHFLCDQS